MLKNLWGTCFHDICPGLAPKKLESGICILIDGYGYRPPDKGVQLQIHFAINF